MAGQAAAHSRVSRSCEKGFGIDSARRSEPGLARLSATGSVQSLDGTKAASPGLAVANGRLVKPGGSSVGRYPRATPSTTCIAHLRSPCHDSKPMDPRSAPFVRTGHHEGQAPAGHPDLAPTVKACYEAGTTGHGLHRLLSSKGVRCDEVTPSLIPKAAGDRVKTGKRDARRLARLHRMGELAPSGSRASPRKGCGSCRARDRRHRGPPSSPPAIGWDAAAPRPGVAQRLDMDAPPRPVVALPALREIRLPMRPPAPLAGHRRACATPMSPPSRSSRPARVV